MLFMQVGQCNETIRFLANWGSYFGIVAHSEYLALLRYTLYPILLVPFIQFKNVVKMRSYFNTNAFIESKLTGLVGVLS